MSYEAQKISLENRFFLTFDARNLSIPKTQKLLLNFNCSYLLQYWVKLGRSNFFVPLRIFWFWTKNPSCAKPIFFGTSCQIQEAFWNSCLIGLNKTKRVVSNCICLLQYVLSMFGAVRRLSCSLITAADTAQRNSSCADMKMREGVGVFIINAQEPGGFRASSFGWSNRTYWQRGSKKNAAICADRGELKRALKWVVPNQFLYHNFTTSLIHQTRLAAMFIYIISTAYGWITWNCLRRKSNFAACEKYGKIRSIRSGNR